MTQTHGVITPEIPGSTVNILDLFRNIVQVLNLKMDDVFEINGYAEFISVRITNQTTLSTYCLTHHEGDVHFLNVFALSRQDRNLLIQRLLDSKRFSTSKIAEMLWISTGIVQDVAKMKNLSSRASTPAGHTDPNQEEPQ